MNHHCREPRGSNQCSSQSRQVSFNPFLVLHSSARNIFYAVSFTLKMTLTHGILYLPLLPHILNVIETRNKQDEYVITQIFSILLYSCGQRIGQNGVPKRSTCSTKPWIQFFLFFRHMYQKTSLFYFCRCFNFHQKKNHSAVRMDFSV